MDKKEVSVCMSIYNQENIITMVLDGIYNNKSENVKEIVLVLDGCTDSTPQIVDQYIKEHPFMWKIGYGDNVFETKANNISFKLASCEYIFSLQDDMILTHLNYDKRLSYPFNFYDNLLAVTARNVQNEEVYNGRLRYYNVAGADVHTPNNLFCIRSVFCRGPVCYNHEKLELLNYLNEDFAPLFCDDKEISLRAYKEYGWIVGAYRLNYESPLQWGKTRNTSVNEIRTGEWELRNELKIVEKYGQFLKESIHDQDILMEYKE